MWPGAPTWGWPRGAAHAIGLVAALVLAPRSGLAAPEKASPWHPGSVARIQGPIHWNASDVPAFPMEDHRFQRPSDWPQSMTIGGVPCALRIHAWDDDDAIAVVSLDDVEPNSRVMLFYDAASSGWSSANAGWGPRYLWNEKGKLIQRIWYEPDSSRLVTSDYTYYKDGKLLGYSRREEKRRQHRIAGRPYTYLSEFFSKDGRLIAVAYENMTAHSRDSVYAWMGAVVPYDRFRMKTHVLYSSAHPGNR